MQILSVAELTKFLFTSIHGVYECVQHVQAHTSVHQKSKENLVVIIHK